MNTNMSSPTTKPTNHDYNLEEPDPIPVRPDDAGHHLDHLRRGELLRRARLAAHILTIQKRPDAAKVRDALVAFVTGFDPDSSGETAD